jgi:hypothetical protein
MAQQRLSERLAVDEHTRELARRVAREHGITIAEAVRYALAVTLARAEYRNRERELIDTLMGEGA